MYKKFNMQGVYYSLLVNTPDPTMGSEEWLLALLNAVICYFKRSSKIDVKSGDRIGMSLRNTELNTDPVYISLRRADQLEGYVILDHIMKIFDSNKEFFINGHLTIQFDHIQMPHGTGRVTRKFGQTTADFIENKACYIKCTGSNNPDDKYCLPYALVLSRAWARVLDKASSHATFRKIKDSFILVRDEALQLCDDAGVRISDLYGGCSFDEVKMFQRILPQYQIVIYGSESVKIMYTDKRYEGKRVLNIMLHDNHYTAMRSVQACFGARYICFQCETHTNTKADHVCKYACTQCQVTPKCNTDQLKTSCSTCNRFFYGFDCYFNHLKKGKKGKKNTCELKKNCPKCKSSLSKGHICGKRRCFTCEKLVKKDNHLCFMPKYESKRQDKTYLYVFYDLETQQSSCLSEHEPDKFKHVPNLCVTQQVCSKCIKSTDMSVDCKTCGSRENVSNGSDCIQKLMDYLVEMKSKTITLINNNKTRTVPQFDQIIVLAHNNSSFDGQFVLKYIYDSDRFRQPRVIMNGTKIIEISLWNNAVKFIDSLIYFQKGLSELPKLFGFEGSKGHYPFLFNTDENEYYRGPIPSKKFYGYDNMMAEARESFDKWYGSHDSSYIFDNKKELISYCKMDVTILRKACVKFILSFWDSNQIDPFVDASTIAGACNKVFRSNYLIDNTIGILPANGYRLSENQSMAALKWLTFVEYDNNIEIQHAGRGREFQIPDVGRVDGYHKDSNTVLEFDGCYWHSCTACFPAYYANDISSEFVKRRDATQAKHDAIMNAGYRLVVMRECDFNRELEENPAVNELLNHHPMVINSPLRPREAFYGGRTNANTLYFKSDSQTKMHYYDICSLYPYINKTAKYPVGHPTVYVGEQCQNVSWEKMDGLMKVTISPPRGLSFPVLPSKIHDRLMFVLCHTCGVNLNQCPCEHGENERQLTGTWVMDEVKLAVQKGYKIVQIHEIWSYKVTQYDPVTGTGGFFSEFINHFLKIKTEASGWPKWCKSDEEKNIFIKKFFKRERILLDKNNIEDNPALRSMAKLMLNSFWGRFGMRSNLAKCKVVETARDLQSLIMSPKLDVQSVIPINESKMLLSYVMKDEAVEVNNSTNVVIAAFTTAYARMELYKYLEFLGEERVFYYDTDSIIFTSREGEAMPEKGDFLGQMTDELEGYGPGSYIIEFVSGGPKNYSYKVYSPTTNETHIVVKVKGVTLNYENSKIVNFDLMKKMVIDRKISSVELGNNSIRRTNIAEVYSTRVKKTYRENYTKRQKTGINHTTIPYGY